MLLLGDPHDDLLRLAPYLGEFAEACLLEGQDTALLCAIALRETWAGWAPGYVPAGDPCGRGDGGHGFGLFQIDDRGPYQHWPREFPQASAHLQARWACQVLSDARRELAGWRTHPAIEEAILCAYNAGSPRVGRMLGQGLDPNAVTTGRDYGHDVLLRRDRLRFMYPGTFPTPTNGGVA